jgi:hypothetical protein
MKIRGIPRYIHVPWFLGKKRGIPWYFLSGGTQLYLHVLHFLQTELSKEVLAPAEGIREDLVRKLSCY